MSVYTGVDIFPKLPVYLRTHHTTWLRNQRVRDAVTKAASGVEKLKRINAATMYASSHPSSAVPLSSTGAHTSRSRPTVTVPPTMPQPSAKMTPPTGHTLVAGSVVGGVAPTITGTKRNQKRKHGERDKDLKQRIKRKCLRCVHNKHTNEEAETCNGRWTGVCDRKYVCAMCASPQACKCLSKKKK